MDVQGIASNQINFKSNTKIKSTIDTIKEKLTDEDKTDVIILGLTAAGAIALGALAAAKKGKVPKAPKAPTPDDVVDAAQTAAKNFNQVKVQHATKEERLAQAIAQGKEQAQSAVDRYLVQGERYADVKADATKNLSKEAKDIVKAALDKAHSGKVAADIEREHKLSENVVTTINSSAKAKNLRQGVQHATNEEAERVIDKALNAQKVAEKNAEHATARAEEIGTKKANKRAKIAQNKAERTRVETQRTIEKATNRVVENAQNEETKLANKAIQESHAGFENGQIKMLYQEDNGAKTRLKNLISRKTKHGKMTREQALVEIAKDTKQTDAVRQLASESLGK